MKDSHLTISEIVHKISPTLEAPVESIDELVKDRTFIQAIRWCLNSAPWNVRDSDDPLFSVLTEEFISKDDPINWLYHEEAEKINDFIYLNTLNPNISWDRVSRRYFEFQNKNYCFYLYIVVERHQDLRSELYVFNLFLKLFKPTMACYIFNYCASETYDYEFFIANESLMDNLRQEISLPFEKASFFLPEQKSNSFLRIKDDLLQIQKAGGFISALNNHFIELPTSRDHTSQQATEWLISMIPEMKARVIASNSSELITTAIHTRNLFVSLARHMIYDTHIANEIEKRKPLWGDSDLTDFVHIIKSDSRLSQKILDYFLPHLGRKKIIDYLFNNQQLAKETSFPILD